MKNILVTGGSGFIGKAVIKELAGRGFTIAVLSRRKNVGISSDIAEVIVGDLFQIENILHKIKEFGPESVIHLAWDVSKDFWESRENIRWLRASEKFFYEMFKIGVQKITLAGTCAEYDWKNNAMPLNEFFSETIPTTLYGQTKADLWNSLEVMSKKFGTSSANGRIFFPIGIGEEQFKLVSDVTTKLLRDGMAEVGVGTSRRDFIDVRDVGAAIALVSVSDVRGPVNIGNGTGLSIQEVMDMILDAIGSDLNYKITYGPGGRNGLAVDTVLADVGRLKNELGFRSSIPMSSCVTNLVESIREGFHTP